MEEQNKLWIDYIPLTKLKAWPRNPKLHAKEDIRDSINRFGFTDPIIVDEKTSRLVSGHGRIEELISMKASGVGPPTNVLFGGADWVVPVIRGNSFTSDSEAEAYILTVNRLAEKGGWNQEMLETMLSEVEPIGFDVVKELEKNIDQALEFVQDTTNSMGLKPTNLPGAQGTGFGKIDRTGFKKDAEESEEPGKKKVSPAFDDIPGNLAGVFELNEYNIFSSSNHLGIPDLLPNMILEEFPQPLLTWGGMDSTPDDEVSNYLYVFGSTSSRGVPYKRTLISWFCHDTHIKTLLETPAYRVGQMLQAEVLGAVVPDVSLWKGNPQVLHIYACYQAQWMGRFMQEAGVKVVPRLEYFLPEVQEFSLLGIPKNPATLATQMHTAFLDEDIPRLQQYLVDGTALICPGQLLVYVSERGAQLVEDVRSSLATDKIILMPTAKKVRRTESRAEQDPYLKELRKRKRGWEGKQEEEDETT